MIYSSDIKEKGKWMMNNKTKAALSFLTAAVIIVIAGVFVFTDRSAEYSAEGLRWNGAFYKSCSGFYEEGKTVAKTADGKWDINEIEGDSEHNFAVVRSGVDDYLYVRSDYKIPERGNPETVYIGTNKITDAESCRILSDIYLNKSETFAVSATKDDVNEWKSLAIGFDGCPVATFRGYIGFSDGKYFLTVDLTDMKAKDDGSDTPFTVICKSVDEKYYFLFKEYIK